MLKPADVLTWQGLRAACDWEVQHFDSKAHVLNGRPLVIQDIASNVRVGKPGKVVGEPWWRDKTGRLTKLTGPYRFQPTAGSTVFCPLAWLDPFRRTLRTWTEPFTLVTMCSDDPIHAIAVDQLVEHGPVARWFAVQVQTTHPRLVAMPLGIDQWMVESLDWALTHPSPRDIEVLVNCRSLGRPERDACLGYWRERRDATIEEFDADAPTRYARHLGQSRFVVSPPGIGWDCFRTYEAIVMGAIPIVLRRPPTSAVLDGLPVLMVDDWAECTPERLRQAEAACLAIRQRREWDTNLRLATWVKRLHEAVADDATRHDPDQALVAARLGCA